MMTPEWNGSDRLPVYMEYVEHPSLPLGRAVVGMPRGKSMTLTSNGWRKVFRNREACARWLIAEMPEALIYKFDNGVTTCGRTVAERFERFLGGRPSLRALAVFPCRDCGVKHGPCAKCGGPLRCHDHDPRWREDLQGVCGSCLPLED